MPLYTAWVNPLMCPELAIGEPPPTEAQLLDYLFAPELERNVAAFSVRYREISAVADIPFAPSEPAFLQKIIWPLRHAKGCYALGNFVGCIALCGMVGEMASILCWDIAEIHIGGQIMTEKTQEKMFGRRVEKLDQRRRIEVLRALGQIDDDTAMAFDQLRETRNQYLHIWSKPHDDAPEHARNCFKHAVHSVRSVTGLSFNNGTVVLKQSLINYMVKRGVVTLDQKDGAT